MAGTSVEVSIKNFLNNGLPALRPKFTAAYLRSFNKAKQAKLKSVQSLLETELGLTAKDIIEVPVLFADIEFAGLADALTAGMVNMLVINGHCIFPQPFGPVVGGKDLFQTHLEGKLKAEGLVPHPIDDWYEYHVLQGEVHCGTNTLRTPTAAKWWEFVP